LKSNNKLSIYYLTTVIQSLEIKQDNKIGRNKKKKKSKVHTLLLFAN